MNYVEANPVAYKNMRNISNSNPSLEINKSQSDDVHVEYEVSVPIVQSFRHTPYHSLWNLNQW